MLKNHSRSWSRVVQFSPGHSNRAKVFLRISIAAYSAVIFYPHNWVLIFSCQSVLVNFSCSVYPFIIITARVMNWPASKSITEEHCLYPVKWKYVFSQERYSFACFNFELHQILSAILAHYETFFRHVSLCEFFIGDSCCKSKLLFAWC